MVVGVRNTDDRGAQQRGDAHRLRPVLVQVIAAGETLQGHVQDMEFTVQHGKLCMLQTRAASARRRRCRRRWTWSRAEESDQRAEAIMRDHPEHIDRLCCIPFSTRQPRAELKRMASGFNAGPARPRAGPYFDAHKAEEKAAKPVRSCHPGAPRNQPRRRRRHAWCPGHPDRSTGAYTATRPWWPAVEASALCVRAARRSS